MQHSMSNIEYFLYFLGMCNIHLLMTIYEYTFMLTWISIIVAILKWIGEISENVYKDFKLGIYHSRTFWCLLKSSGFLVALVPFQSQVLMQKFQISFCKPVMGSEYHCWSVRALTGCSVQGVLCLPRALTYFLCCLWFSWFHRVVTVLYCSRRVCVLALGMALVSVAAIKNPTSWRAWNGRTVFSPGSLNRGILRAAVAQRRLGRCPTPLPLPGVCLHSSWPNLSKLCFHLHRAFSFCDSPPVP